MDIIKQLDLYGIIPVTALDKEEDAVSIGKALCAGGLPVAEVMFRTSAAEASIRAMSQGLPDMLVGAGTVLTTEQVDRAAAAGAKFIVTPGFNPDVVDHCIRRGLPVIPGVSTASQVEQGLARGLKVLKFFPAEASGGVPVLKALAGPYKDVKFVPTGGINSDNLLDYIKLQNVAAVGGSWIVKKDMVAARDFAGIEKTASAAVNKMHNFHLVHLGINAADPKEAMKISAALCGLFGFAEDDRGDKSVFSGKSFEIMKHPGKGTHGHIAIGCTNVERAAFYFKNRGINLLMDTATYRPDGTMKFVYLDMELGGFMFHLVEA